MPVSQPVEKPTVALGKRANTQMEIVFDAKAIIQAEKTLLEQKAKLEESQNQSVLTAAQTINQTLVIEQHDEVDDLFGAKNETPQKEELSKSMFGMGLKLGDDSDEDENLFDK